MTPDPQITPPVKKAHAIKIIRQSVPSIQQLRLNQKNASFQKFSNGVSTKAGSPYALIIALILIIAWATTGPFFDYSDTWQLVINTTTTIVTFLMVFAIQNTQNRDSRAMQIKLDELIKSNHSARSEFVDIEDLSDSELDLLHNEFKDLHEKFEEQKRKSKI